MRKRSLFILALMLMTMSGAWAQGQFGDIPKTVDARDVEVTEIRYLHFMSHDSLVVNPATGSTDTLHIDDGRQILDREGVPAIGYRAGTGTPSNSQHQ